VLGITRICPSRDRSACEIPCRGYKYLYLYCEVRRAAEGWVQACSTLSGNAEFSGSFVAWLRFGPFLCHFQPLALAFHPSGWGLVSDSGMHHRVSGAPLVMYITFSQD
jgi:hypothetical protein